MKIRMERKRQPTPILPWGLSGLLVFTSRISIKKEEEGGILTEGRRAQSVLVYMHVIWFRAAPSEDTVGVTWAQRVR